LIDTIFTFSMLQTISKNDTANNIYCYLYKMTNCKILTKDLRKLLYYLAEMDVDHCNYFTITNIPKSLHIGFDSGRKFQKIIINHSCSLKMMIDKNSMYNKRNFIQITDGVYYNIL
jgi:hypothetical protein